MEAVRSLISALRKVEIGFLEETKGTKDFTGTSEKQVLEFRLLFKTFLTERLKKVLTKCPFFHIL